MILIGTTLDVIDNSGVLKLLCIGNLKNSTLHVSVGNLIVGVVKKIKKNSTIKISSIVRALVVTSKKFLFTLYRNYMKFLKNSAIILSKKYTPIGTRTYCCFYYKKFYYDSLKLQSITIK